MLGNAANTFGGVGRTIDVLNGILSVGSDGALGAAGTSVTLDFDGAAGVGLRATSTFSTGRTIILAQANNALEVTAGNILTLTTPFSLPLATNNLSKNDNGIVELTVSNAGWTGALTINAGAIRLTNSNAAGSTSIAAE